MRVKMNTGQTLHMPDSLARDFISRGLASDPSKEETTEAKSEAAPQNKAEAAPANKAEAAPAKKSRK